MEFENHIPKIFCELSRALETVQFGLLEENLIQFHKVFFFFFFEPLLDTG